MSSSIFKKSSLKKIFLKALLFNFTARIFYKLCLLIFIYYKQSLVIKIMYLILFLVKSDSHTRVVCAIFY